MSAPEASPRQRAALAEPILLAAAAVARSNGIVIICDAFDADGGCCVLAALNMAPPGNIPLSDDLDRLAEEYDAIELGFDGIPYRKARTQSNGIPPIAFWNLGLRLRKALRPIRAERHRRNVERAERASVRARIRFTS